MVAVVTAIGACGAPAKVNFVAGADAICASAVRATRSLPLPSQAGNGSAQALTALAHYVNSVVPIVQSEAEQLRALRPSKPRDRGALASYLNALNQTIAAYRDLAAAATRHDAQGVASAEAALRASPAPALAARYGLRSCGMAGATVA